MRELYNTSEVSSYKKPLIILIDEFDILIHNIHHQEHMTKHKWLRTLVYDKESYNSFLSEYALLFPYVIYIFTMNTSKSTIDKLDTSYLRQGRMDKIYEVH